MTKYLEVPTGISLSNGYKFQYYKTQMTLSFPQETEEPRQLASVEVESIGTVGEILISANRDTSSLFYSITKDYLVLSIDKYYSFANLKLTGKLLYISLAISLQDRKRLVNEGRLTTTKGPKFLRYNLNSYDDILLYSDLIINAFDWAYPQKQIST